MVGLNYRDPRPIYEQLRENLRRQIVSGVLPPDERLPSVRELAAAERVNPNTVQRAYRELEAEGYIYSVPGRGSFAADRREIDGKRKAELLLKLDECVRELVYLGESIEGLCRRFRDAEGGNLL